MVSGLGCAAAATIAAGSMTQAATKKRRTIGFARLLAPPLFRFCWNTVTRSIRDRLQTISFFARAAVQ
jgi:hypothetical protein